MCANRQRTRRGAALGIAIAAGMLLAVAATELHRQATEKESGALSARSEALRRLHELLARERAALQAHGPGARPLLLQAQRRGER